ncbi:MAG: DnaJ domain-containing protein [Pseudomonadota bacterium]
MLNYYDVLEVSQNASAEVIRAAYKSLIQRYHPDKDPGNAVAGQRAALIVEAYETLSDAGKRAAFDRRLREVRQPATAVAPRGGRNGRSGAVVWLAALAAMSAVTYFTWEAWSPPGAGARSADHRESSADAGRVNASSMVIARQLYVPLDDAASADARYVLHVPRITLKIAASATDIRRRLMDAEAQIGQVLEDGLAQASYSRLIAPDGEDYLSSLVVDALVLAVLAPDSPEVRAELLAQDIGNILAVGLPESYSVRAR